MGGGVDLLLHICLEQGLKPLKVRSLSIHVQFVKDDEYKKTWLS